jgi:hypothetical protein
VARRTEMNCEDACRKARVPLLLSSSTKAGLDIKWNDPEQKDGTIERLIAQLGKLNDWLDRNRLAAEEPLKPSIEALAQVRQQRLGNEEWPRTLAPRRRRGRRVSIVDPHMRHGRKSNSKRFDGYKHRLFGNELMDWYASLARRLPRGQRRPLIALGCSTKTSLSRYPVRSSEPRSSLDAVGV